VLFVVDAKTRRIEEVGEGVDYGVRRAGAGEEEKFLRGVRVCRSCRPVLTQQQYWQEVTSIPPFVRFYDVSLLLELLNLCSIDGGARRSLASRRRLRMHFPSSRSCFLLSGTYLDLSCFARLTTS